MQRERDICDKDLAEFWKKIFDADHAKVGFKEPIRFNNAGASQSPKSVLRVVVRHMAKEAMLGGYLAASNAEAELDAVYTSVARLLNSRCSKRNAREEIALVESATVAWTRMFYSIAETLIRQTEKLVTTKSRSILERVILMSEAEYAANVVAAVKLAKEQNERSDMTKITWRVLSIPSTTYKDKQGNFQSTGIVDLTVLNDMLSGSWKLDDETYLDPDSIAMVCITHIPTNSGIINPVNEIGESVAKYNSNYENISLPKCFYLVDACQSIGQIKLDVQKMNCHALAATGRKYLRGPRGTGFLYIQKEIARVLRPSHVDHSSTPVKKLPSTNTTSVPFSIDLTKKLEFHHKEGAARFEFWESNIACKLGLGAAIDYAINEIGIDIIETKCCQLGDLLRSRLRKIEGVRVYHDVFESQQCGIVAFAVNDVAPIQIKDALISCDTSDCFEVSVVPATSTPVDSAKSYTTDLVRASLSYFNTEKEIDMFCNELITIIKQ